MLPSDSLASQLDPLIVTAPTIRCGTTLLQRLICSSQHALLFGEPAGNDLVTALRVIKVQTSMYAANREQFAGGLDAFAGGNRNDWMIDLMPDLDGYLRAIVDGYLQPLAYCRDFALRAGRRVWGLKYPGWSGEVLQAIMTFLPRAKLIYIHRDVVSALRSAKARGSVRRTTELNAFCAQWAANMRMAAQLRDSDRVMVLSYDQLGSDSETTLQRLEAFTGVTGIDRGVLAHRVNEWPEYIPPAELTADELRVAEEALSA
jgi:hypothetical protein